MSDPYIGEIRLFAGYFAPQGWAFCEGQIISISENDSLFNLIGTTYGGDGQSTFALPDLNGRVAVHQGGSYVLGQAAGTETVTLTANQIPGHTHAAATSAAPGTANTPANNVFADEGPAGIATPFAYAPFDAANQAQLRGDVITPSGGNQPHASMQPYLAVSFIISLFGIYPSQT